jgi:glyoxylate reductase
VYEREPEIHPRLLSAPRTVLMPHIGSASQDTRQRMAALATTAVVEVLAGNTPSNVVASPA